MDMLNYLEKHNIPATDSHPYSCKIGECDVVEQSAGKMLSHYGTMHRNDKNFTSSCLHSDVCFHKTPFKSYDGLYKHLKTFHPTFFPMSVKSQQNGGLQELQNDSSTNSAASSGDSLSSNSLDLHMASADFVLNLLSEQKLNQVNVQYVMKEAAVLVNRAVKQKIMEASSILTANNIDHTCLSSLLESNEDSFALLHNQKGQNKFFSEKFGMIEPIPIDLPTGPEDFGRHKTGKDQHFKKQSFIYISLLKQLERNLNFSDVSEEISKEKTQKQGQFSNFEDGSNFQSNPFYQKYRDALQILLYLDEVQMCGETGSRTKNNKQVFVYFSIGNLPLKFRSSFSSINLLSIFSNTNMKRFGLNILLRPIVDDIKKLESGVLMTVKNKSSIVRGTLAAVVADNLASHQIGGFKIGFSKGYRKCRFCLGTDQDIQTKFFDCQFVPRSKAQHNFQCSALTQDELKDHFSRLYGIVENSILNELSHFHVIGGLPPDVMHDLLEGIVPLVVKKIILHCINAKYFTLAQLNQIISSFKYGHREVIDKPSHIDASQLKSEGKIRQSAAQIWLLAINLPLMVGSLVDKSDNAWHCFTVLLEICRLVFKSSISEFQIEKLEHLIEEFLTEYTEFFYQSYSKKDAKYGQKCRIIPKMHHLVHYPRFIRLLGPLQSFWCMRFEAKHSYFKSLQRRIRNYINVPFTLSMRHQQWQCRQFKSAGEFLLKFEISKSAPKPLMLCNHAHSGQIATLLNFESLSVHVSEHKWVDIGRNKFKVRESLILCPLQGSTRSAFGLITSVISHCDRLVFVCKLFRTIEFDPHFQSFIISQRSDNFTLALSADDLTNFSVYQHHSLGFVRSKQLYVTTKTEIHAEVL